LFGQILDRIERLRALIIAAAVAVGASRWLVGRFVEIPESSSAEWNLGKMFWFEFVFPFLVACVTVWIVSKWLEFRQ